MSTTTLKNIRIISSSSFQSILSTDDDTLYFVEDGFINTLATSGTIALTDNSINAITPKAAVTFTLPAIADDTTIHQILVQVNMSTVYTITLGTSYYFNKTAPDMTTAGQYNLIYEYDNANRHWIVGCVAKGTA